MSAEGAEVVHVQRPAREEGLVRVPFTRSCRECRRPMVFFEPRELAEVLGAPDFSKTPMRPERPWCRRCWWCASREWVAWREGAR